MAGCVHLNVVSEIFTVSTGEVEVICTCRGCGQCWVIRCDRDEARNACT